MKVVASFELDIPEGLSQEETEAKLEEIAELLGSSLQSWSI